MNFQCPSVRMVRAPHVSHQHRGFAVHLASDLITFLTDLASDRCGASDVTPARGARYHQFTEAGRPYSPNPNCFQRGSAPSTCFRLRTAPPNPILGLATKAVAKEYK
jgi:hypothetical protein